MLTGFEVCALYTALKVHFAPGTYDFFKYNGKIKNLTPSSYELRKDKWFFHKLSKVHPDKAGCTFFLASNFFVRDNFWVRDLLEEEAKIIHLEKLRVKESLIYLVNEDIDKVIGELTVVTFKDMIAVKNGQYPDLLTAVMHGHISKETLIVLNAAVGFLPSWKNKITDTILFPAFAHKCAAYAPFLEIDAKAVRQMLRKKLA
jgi:hypothetical protein